MKKVLTVIGARPQFVKAAVLSRLFVENPGWQEIIVHTGQHFDQNMSDIFFSQMQIPKPHYQLNINGLSHAAMTGQMLEKVEDVLVKEKPDLVLVYGDTNSTLAGALAAVKLHIPVAHVEAGLRSYNRKMPEEINRVLTDHVSRWLFCPNDSSRSNLAKEGITKNIHIVGDIMFDAVQFYLKHAKAADAIKNLASKESNFYLCTIHRQENTDYPERLRSIFEALESLSRGVKIILPLHPRTRAKLEKLNFSPSDNVIMLDPVGYFEMLHLLQACRLVLTDSGGLQKEAYFFNKPCITLRDETEWTETVQVGANKVVGADRNAIVSAHAEFLRNPPRFDERLFGNGNSGQRIIEVLAGSVK